GRCRYLNYLCRIIMLKSARLLLLTLGALGIGSLLLALLIGSSTAGPDTLLSWWSGTTDPEALEVLLRLRLPRALAAFGTGAATNSIIDIKYTVRFILIGELYNGV
ncbi:MAG TPA: hypothetical protein PLO59_07280, partial [Bacteroidia bacterium]|nr:hypothetical protein [Bacteroidia bacterium]